MFFLQWEDFSETADSPDFNKIYSLQPEIDSIHKVGQYSFFCGDNYPILKMLLPLYKEKIDFIYIDPPYNTGKTTYTYNDAIFTGGVSSYLATDRHSAWLSFMQRRLTLAQKMLAPTGCIFISIGQEQMHYLKLLCDQIFGEKNFINDFMWLCGKGKKNTFSRTMQQSTLCYAKDISKLPAFIDYQTSSWALKNKDNDPRGSWFSGSISFNEKRSNPEHQNYYTVTSPSGVEWTRQWHLSEQEMNRLIQENKIYFGKAPSYDHVPRLKIFNGEKSEIIPKNIIDNIETTRSAQKHLDQLLGYKGSFDNPKPVSLIEHFLNICAAKNDCTVLDFFAGSGTTLEAVYNLNQKDGGKRKCILIQKDEPILSKDSPFQSIDKLCVERCKKVLNGKPLTLFTLTQTENQ